MQLMNIIQYTVPDRHLFIDSILNFKFKHLEKVSADKEGSCQTKNALNTGRIRRPVIKLLYMVLRQP